MAAQERRCFARHTGLPIERIVCWDLLTGPPALGHAREYDVLMIGGSGDFMVSQRDLPQFSAVLELLRGVVETGHPTFASCFGFQCLVEALGGQIVYDPERTEVGTYEVSLTPEARRDPLFGELPPRFPAQMGRKDRSERLPEGVIHLASSERSPHQAFRVDGLPIWATQFHPELSAQANRERFVRYREGYAGVSDAEGDAPLERFYESPHAERLLRDFLDLVCS